MAQDLMKPKIITSEETSQRGLDEEIRGGANANEFID
jgi:hypothetical protein